MSEIDGKQESVEPALPWFDIAELPQKVVEKKDGEAWPFHRNAAARWKLPNGKRYSVLHEEAAFRHVLKELYGEFFYLDVQFSRIVLKVPSPHFGWWRQGMVLGSLKLMFSVQDVKVYTFYVEAFDGPESK